MPWDASQARSRGEAYADRTDWAVWSLPECTWVSQVAPTFQPLADSKLAFIVGNYTVYLNDILDDFTPWSITHGTLLGAYRHDGMIPYVSVMAGGCMVEMSRGMGRAARIFPPPLRRPLRPAFLTLFRWDLDYDISLPAINESYWHMRRATEAHPFWSPRLGVCAPGMCVPFVSGWAFDRLVGGLLPPPPFPSHPPLPFCSLAQGKIGSDMTSWDGTWRPRSTGTV